MLCLGMLHAKKKWLIYRTEQHHEIYFTVEIKDSIVRQVNLESRDLSDIISVSISVPSVFYRKR
jgi:hypothetical protein